MCEHTLNFINSSISSDANFISEHVRPGVKSKIEMMISLLVVGSPEIFDGNFTYADMKTVLEKIQKSPLFEDVDSLLQPSLYSFNASLRFLLADYFDWFEMIYFIQSNRISRNSSQGCWTHQIKVQGCWKHQIKVYSENYLANRISNWHQSDRISQ